MVLSLAASTLGLPSAQYGGYGDIGAPGFGPGIGHGLAGHAVVGHHKDPCEEGTETIMVKKCHLEPDKRCSSEEVSFSSILFLNYFVEICRLDSLKSKRRKSMSFWENWGGKVGKKMTNLLV